jgi:hypothetical protein
VTGYPEEGITVEIRKMFQVYAFFVYVVLYGEIVGVHCGLFEFFSLLGYYAM